MRTSGPVPVVLALDEMGVSEQFLRSALCHILAIARSRNLRLLVACQHLAQLSDKLRAALLANTAVQAFFRLGYADAKAVAASLAAGTGEQVSRNARVLVIAPDARRRDQLCTFVAERGGEYSRELASRFWLAEPSVLEKSVLEQPSLTGQEWRRPKDSEFHPLVSSKH